MQFTNEINQVLDEKRWVTVNENLLAKMLSEYTYEDMIQPKKLSEINGQNVYQLRINEEIMYRFNGTPRMFESLDVESTSIKRQKDNKWEAATSAITFLLDIQPIIGMSTETAAHLIKELNQTLLADAHLLAKEAKTSDELIYEDYSRLEGEMSGHPWITYNKGRIGFDYDDYIKFAPEHQNEVKLLWIAVHKEIATFQSVEGLDYLDVISAELGDEIHRHFYEMITSKGGLPSNYFLMPIHQWQWENVIIQTFAEDLATKKIIALGEGNDLYLPQQSIRTFANQSDKKKYHVKVPMSILNTLVYRGLPTERTLIAPKITRFIKGIYEKDSFLKEECRVILPGEVASINYGNKYYEQLKNAPYHYLEMLGVIWRESIYGYLEKDEQALTLAALLHVDQNGTPYIQSVIKQSNLTEKEWMEEFFKVVMDPLLHYLYQYGTVFSPHGQNTILVIKDHKPHRLAIKDFVDDVNVSDQPFPELASLTDDLKAVLRSEPPEGLVQFIFTGLFICHLRYLANIMVKHGLLEEKSFWELLAKSIVNYQQKFPHLEQRFKLFDFFKPELTKLCLNRNRMVEYGYTEGDDRPHASEFGKVKNALTQFQITEEV